MRCLVVFSSHSPQLITQKRPYACPISLFPISSFWLKFPLLCFALQLNSTLLPTGLLESYSAATIVGLLLFLFPPSINEAPDEIFPVRNLHHLASWVTNLQHGSSQKKKSTPM